MAGTSPVPILIRVRTGIRLYPEGWRVIVEWPDRTDVYDPPFATEAEAEAMARDTAQVIRDILARAGVTLIDGAT